MSDELNFNAPAGGAVTTSNADEQEFNQRKARLLALLRGRLHWAILLALLLGGGLGYLAFNAIVPVYQSTGQVVVDPKRLIYDDINGVNTNEWSTFLQTQDRLIRSVEVAERALASDTWKSRPEDAVPYEPYKFAKSIEVTYDKRDRSNRVFEIAFMAEDPLTAAAGNQSLLQAYQAEYSFQTQTRYASRIAELQATIQRAELAIKNQLALRRTILTDAEFDALEGQIGSMMRQKFDMGFQLDEVRAQLDARNPTRVNQGATTPADLINADPILNQMQQRIEALENEVAIFQSMGRGPNHYDVRRLTAERDTINAKIKQRIDQLMGSEDSPLMYDQEYEQLRTLEQMWNRQLVDINSSLDSLGQKRMQVAGLMQEIASREDLIVRAKRQMDQIRVELEQAGKTIDILARGVQPIAPYNAGKALQMGVLGSIGGGMLGFGFVMVLGLMDSRLRHAGDARMGMPNTRMLGILPTLPENFADPEQSEKAAHAVHHIRTLLQISNRGTARVFAITSPAAGSGKSSLSVAMGLSFAASESKTLVIDCDLVGAGLTRRVGAVVNRSVESILREDTVLTDHQIAEAMQTARQKGINLKDALVELGLLTKKDLQRLNRRQADSALGILDACQGRSFAECVAHTGIDNFYVLPIGAAKPQDAGLLSPKALRSLITRAREEYDVVLIDTGPCLGSLEASMAAAESDATVLIVSRGDSKAMASRARDHLVSVGANVVGIVFNHALETDMNHSSFASIVSQERRTDPATSLLNADPAAAARFGPLGSAVAAFGTPSKSPNGKPRRAPGSPGSPAVAGAASNGR